MVQIIVNFSLRISHSLQVSFCHLVYFDEFSEQVTLSLPEECKSVKYVDILTYLFFGIPRVYLVKAKILYLLLTHEVVLHATLKVVDLELLAALRHQLVLVQASIVANRVFLTLVEVVQREGAFVWSCDHSSISASSMRRCHFFSL